MHFTILFPALSTSLVLSHNISTLTDCIISCKQRHAGVLSIFGCKSQPIAHNTNHAQCTYVHYKSAGELLQEPDHASEVG